MNTTIKEKQFRQFMTMMDSVADEFICEAFPQKRTYYKTRKAKSHPHRSAACAAAAVICVLTLFVSSNGFAKSLITNAFLAIQNRIDMRGDYSSYATNINQTVTNNGLSVTISEVYCDGINLFVSYILESDEGFSAYSENYANYIQIEYDKLDFIRSGDTVYQLSDLGTAGLEGRYIDEYTFAGLETYSLEGNPFPETFDLEISISKFIPELSFLKNPFQKNGIRGRWSFDIPVTVNSADIQTIEVHAENNGHTIDKVIVSPIMATIYTSYPDIYSGTVNYNIICYDKDSKESLTGEGHYDYNTCTGFVKVPRADITTELEIYIIDNTTLTKSGVERYSYDEIKKHAIVSCTIDLQ